MTVLSKRICIISHQHLCRNPRVLKEAIAIANLGFKVTILTSVYSQELLAEDYELLKGKGINYIFYNNLTINNIISYKNRFLNRAGREANKLKIENVYALGYAPHMALKIALEQNADLYICHQELPTYIGTILLRKGKKVVCDMEDWYSEDLLNHARKYRPQKILVDIEEYIMRNANLVLTTSYPMAQQLAHKYGGKTPKVIHNSFSAFGKINIKKNPNHIKLIWISQTIGEGRGLESIVNAVNKINKLSYEINIRGVASEIYKQTLRSLLINPRHKIIFLPLIPNCQISNDLINYDIGLALELDKPLSRDLTLTNKIFHYLSVGLPVIASKTQGQLSLKSHFGKNIYYYNNTIELTAILDTLEPMHILEQKKEVMNIYKEKYDWMKEEIKLQNAIKGIL